MVMVARQADAAGGSGGGGSAAAKGGKKVTFGGTETAAADGMDVDMDGSMAADMDTDMRALTADPKKLTAPIKSVQDKFELLPAFLKV